MGVENTARLPLIPLPSDLVLLPGTTLRIPIRDRADVPTLLSKAFSRVTQPRNDRYALSVGCVPLRSSKLSRDGRKLLKDIPDDNTSTTESQRVDPARATKNDLFQYGTFAKIIGVQGRPTAEPTLVVEGPDAKDKDLRALFLQTKQLSRELLNLLRLASLLRSNQNSLSPLTARRFESYIAKKEFAEAGSLADFMTEVAEHNVDEKLRVLAALDLQDRLGKVVDLLSKRIEFIKGGIKITTITSTTVPSNMGIDISQLDERQREALARRSMMNMGGMIPPGGSPGSMGGENDENETNELDELKQRLDAAQLPPEAKKVSDRELKRLRKMNAANAEYNVCRTYLENLAEVPWTKGTEDQLGVETLNKARKQLDDDHYGLQKIKKRLLEYLAVLRLKQTVNADLDSQISKLKAEMTPDKGVADESYPASEADRNAVAAKLHVLESRRRVDKSPILLLVGPPGTGKTSLAKSVALSLGRKFHRISLGGVRDEAEIRGHRRTYVAAMPGLIVSGLKKVGVNNPVFLLDEIDKVGGSNFHGDPSAAMLEVLDPEQNHTFSDHYINIPIDLSKVLFIATANSLDTIPPPLLDRMETITLAGYTTVEKRHIARQHLLPKQIRTNGLNDADIDLFDEVLDAIITSYTREAGVRNLEREIGSVCRSKAVQYADAHDSQNPSSYNPRVSISDLEDILGIAKFEDELAESADSRTRPGIVTGLVAYSTGTQGSILFIEVADMPSGSSPNSNSSGGGGGGRVQLTGKLGSVLKESVEVALTWVKAHAYDLRLTSNPDEDIMRHRSIHVHCPGGAVPKDGPSAGLAHTIALVSLFSGKPVPPTIAMTGEVSLRGKVHPVGGIVQKLIGAQRAGVRLVLLPKGNEKDVREVPGEVREGVEIVFVK
ncbi:MAG: hypothetical protein Q9160_000603 [Pyrenula sp. 1 TL-2023]